jgi:hypothetical protein
MLAEFYGMRCSNVGIGSHGRSRMTWWPPRNHRSTLISTSTLFPWRCFSVTSEVVKTTCIVLTYLVLGKNLTFIITIEFVVVG